MKIKDVTKKERKDVRINLKISKKNSKWMKEKNISPQKLFDTSLKELQAEK